MNQCLNTQNIIRQVCLWSSVKAIVSCWRPTTSWPHVCWSWAVNTQLPLSAEVRTPAPLIIAPNNSNIISKNSPLFGIFDVGVNQQTVHFRVDVFHSNLETVEATGFSHLDFLSKSLHLEHHRTQTIRIEWLFTFVHTRLPLNSPSSHWQCHHSQQKKPRHERRNISPHLSGNPSAGDLLTGQPWENTTKLSKCCNLKTKVSVQAALMPYLKPVRTDENWISPMGSNILKLTSSAVQKEASAFLYICQMSWYWIGKMTKRWGLSFRRGSSFTAPFLAFVCSLKKKKKKKKKR